MPEQDATVQDDDGPAFVSAPRASADFSPGRVLGRYVVVRPLGKGGMGAVMLAFDTQLGRRVALKVLLTRVAPEAARRRLVLEAQAMARLAHPNVVGIYDVGVHDGDVFLAMEYVDGTLLSAWLEQEHSIGEVLAVMKQAGRGLAAAHEAGLAHRDFKPSNVLIAGDGRARVFDFGIAGTEVADEASAPTVSRVSRAEPDEPSSGLTSEDALLGTVGYASPEQTTGRPSGARSDVFSFSVTLWRALYGTLPFDASTLEAYVLAVNGAARPARPAGTKVPAWIHAILERGLASDPGARFASMQEVLAALGTDPTRARLRLAAAVFLGLGAALVAVGVTRRAAQVDGACRAEGDAAPAAWSVKRRAVDNALRAETDPFAAERTDRTLALLDTYATTWRKAQVESCEATRVAHTQSEAAHDRRSQCLLDERMQLEVVADALAADDPVLHRQSLSMANGLDPPGRCTDASTSKTLVPLPRDPVVRAKVLDARRELLRAKFRSPGTGGLEGARKLAEHAHVVAREVGEAPTAAMAEFTLGYIEERAHDYEQALRFYFQATATAEGIGADKLAGQAAASAALLLTVRLHRTDAAEAWLAFARSKLARLGGDESLELILVNTTAALASGRDIRREVELDEQALALAIRLYGATGQSVCVRYNNLGYAYFELGALEEAEATLKKALACHTGATGPEDEDLSIEYTNLSDVQRAVGDWEGALASAQRASELHADRDPDNPMLSATLALESLALSGEGKAADATSKARRALDVATRRSPTIVASALYALGVARTTAGDAAGARDACGRAVATDGVGSPDALYADDALRCLGEAELALGDVLAAREHLELTSARPIRLAPGALALAQFALARALAMPPARIKGKPHGPTDAPRAVTLAEGARDDLRVLAARYAYLKPSLDAVEAWLAGRPRH